MFPSTTKKSSIVRDTAEIFVERKEESSNLKGLLDHFSNLKKSNKNSAIVQLCETWLLKFLSKEDTEHLITTS